MDIHYFGIRHHGSGTARHLLAALQALPLDYVLIEGPPEANPLLPLAAQADMKPPVALLLYHSEQAEQALYYPFAEFSPEWQALRHAQKNQIPVEFFDLPLAQRWALGINEDESASGSDPLDEAARLAGYRDGDHFWESCIEQRRDGEALFSAIQSAMAALRGEETPQHGLNDLREAAMRQKIQQLAKAGVKRLAVVCGAWHVPALQRKSSRADAALLKGLPKCKVEGTWLPWTHRRLALESGYGAGLEAPAWHAHRWRHPDDDGVLWLAAGARLLRDKNHDVSAAHLIETHNLARALAALRGQSHIHLQDFSEAFTAVIGQGEDVLLRSIQESWWRGDAIGEIPEETPQLPLIRAVAQAHKSLRLPLTAEVKTHTLDLRKDLDARRSVFMHRLRLLDVDWAQPQSQSGQGTFKEIWQSQYQPEQQIALNQRAVYGNSMESACEAYVLAKLRQQASLAALIRQLQQALPADLPRLIHRLSLAIHDESAQVQDAESILQALPPLAELLRYGSLRTLDTEHLRPLLRVLLLRLAVGGVQAFLHPAPEEAERLSEALQAVQLHLGLLNDAALQSIWLDFLTSLAEHGRAHRLLAGQAAQMLFQQQRYGIDTVSLQLRQNLSSAQPYAESALWLQGFLQGAGTLLLLHGELWRLLADWVRELPQQAFIHLLPILRRTFASFEFGERLALSDRVQAQSEAAPPIPSSPEALHHEDGLAAAQQLLGLLSLAEKA